jgi:hypothetical protein
MDRVGFEPTTSASKVDVSPIEEHLLKDKAAQIPPAPFCYRWYSVYCSSHPDWLRRKSIPDDSAQYFGLEILLVDVCDFYF